MSPQSDRSAPGRSPAAAPSEGPATGKAAVDLAQVLDRLDGLPTLPAFVTKMLALADDPDVSTKEIAEMVSGDQAMAAAVLRLVNAPFYGLGRKISSIQHAVLLLGLRTVRNLALSAVLVKSFGEASQDRRFDRPRLWRHAVASAAGARLVAQRLRSMDPEEAFLAGLVHDMGIIILDQYFHAGFRRVGDLVFSMGMPLPEAEREVFGRDHAYVGRQLARRWNFPAGVAEAIGCHHEPSRARLNPTLTSIVHLADYLETMAPPDGIASPGEAGNPAEGTVDAGPEAPLPADEKPDPFCEVGVLDEGALAVLGLGPDEVEGLRLAIAAERWRAEAFLSMVP